MKKYNCFDQKAAVITGAGNGIGRALAQQLQSNGTRLALADVSHKGLDETVKTLSSSEGVTTYELDVSDLVAYKKFVEQVVADHGQIDIVINNAGIIHLHTFDEGRYEDYEKTMAVNFFGVLYGCKEFLPYLRKSPEAWLVNVCSADGLIGFANFSSYSSSKFAVHGLTDSLRASLRKSSISVSCVYPSGVSTNIINTATVSEGAKKTEKTVRTAMKAMSSEDAAGKILKGMAKKENRILVGSDAKIIDILTRMFPTALDGFYNRFM